MSTGTQDPFEDVKRPICGEFVEIGQPTFAELIWVREVLTRATSGPNPNVGDALRMLAYGKSPVELPEMRKQGVITATPATPAATPAAVASKYSIGLEAQSYKDNVKGLNAAKATIEFKELIFNKQIQPLDETCNSINVCGPGRTNSSANSNFETGVDFWTDAADIALSPTSPTVWDEVNSAIIVSDSGELEVRQRITGLAPDTTANAVSINFELADWEGDDLSELTFGALEAEETGQGVGLALLGTDFTLIKETASVPKRYQFTFQSPDDGIATIFFRLTSGTVKLRNVLVCWLCPSTAAEEICGPVCETGTKETQRVAITSFQLDAPTSPGQFVIDETYSGLTPGDVAQISFNAVTDTDGNTSNFVIKMQSGSVTEQFTTNGPGVKTFESIVQSTGIIAVTITAWLPGGPYNMIQHDYLVCINPPVDDTECDISNVQVLIEWDGITRKPTNLFNAVIRYTIRDPLDPLSITTVTHIPTDEGVLGVSSCDVWKQVGQGGNPQSNILATGLIQSGADAIATGGLVSLVLRDNWIWSIPSTGAGIQDMLSVDFPPPPSGLIESIEVLLLANQVLPSGGDSAPITPSPLACSPDPASEITVSIRYINYQNLQREFDLIIDKDALLPNTADFSIDSWDNTAPLGHGIRGTSARWESFLFVLDSVDGNGLDQCSEALCFSTSGSGVLNLPNFTISNAKGVNVEPCISEVIPTTLTDGESTDEIQSIILPSPSDGTWTLTFDFGTIETTAAIAWDATAIQVRDALSALSNINGDTNVTVSGTGTQDDPFLVTFIGELGSIDHEILVADGALLGGSSEAFVTTENEGTENERQIVDRNDNTIITNFTITFAGQTTVPLIFDRSLNSAQAALEGLSTIGAGNVLVTGDTTDRENSYSGRLIVDFIGDLAAQNVALMTVNPDTQYTVAQSWQGGANGGIDERQNIIVRALGGTFTITTFNVDNTVGAAAATTAALPYNASKALVRQALADAASWLTLFNIDVNTLLDQPAGTNGWRIQWVNELGSTNFPQMTVDGSLLVGAPITIEEVTKGSGTSERQKLQIIDATSGSFTLTATVDAVTETTTAIPWNTTAAGLEAQLLQLGLFNTGELSVADDFPDPLEPEPPIISQFTIIFQMSFGDIEQLIANFAGTLFCDPVILQPNDPGPYKYPLKECVDLSDLSCQSGPLLCRPSEGDEPIPVVDCCDNETISVSANVSRRLQIERDLFDPNRMVNGGRLTLRDLALIKGLKPDGYTPYERNFRTGTLIEASWSREIKTKLSFILIENELDTLNGRQRVLNHISQHREILPARFTWPETSFT